MKLLHATDVHTDLRKYEAIVNHANSSNVDAVLITGDLSDKDSGAYQKIYQTAMRSAIEKHASKEALATLKNTEAAAQSVFPLINLMQHTGAKPENLEALIGELDVDENIKERLKTDAKDFKANFEKFRKLNEQFQAALKKDQNSEKIENEADKTFEDYQKKEIKDIHAVLSQCKKQVYAVTGNHDPGFISEFMENVHFLDKDGTAEICGIRFAGTPSTYESVKGITDKNYKHLEDYVIKSKEGEVEKSPEYNRLKKDKFDVLATHCGIADRTYRDKMQGPDMVAYRLMKEKEVKLNLSGHIHDELIKKVDDILQLNPGAERVYEIDMEKKDGKVHINKVVVYKYVLDAGTSNN